MNARTQALRRALGETHGVADAAIRTVISPYRVCPIGAHLDHQHGPVLGAAVTAWTLLAFAPSPDPGCRLESVNFPGEVRFDLGDPGRPGAARGWGVYARGAAFALRERLPARVRGILGRVDGSLPGSGLSSSASVLLAYLEALAAVNGIELDARERVALSRRAENEYVGVASGVLDPASIVGSRRGELLRIDTAEVAWERLALGAGAPACRWLVAFSGATRNLAETDYNRRVAECGEAARRLGERAGLAGVRRLGDLPAGVLAEHLEALPPELAARARHIEGESARVRQGAALWRQGDLEGFGRLMNASYRSSRENFPTASPELVRLQEILEEVPGVLGARFSGAGFGGATVALVRAELGEQALRATRSAFRASFPQRARSARFLLVDGEDGVRIQGA